MALQLVDRNGGVFAADALSLHRYYGARYDERSFAAALVRVAGFVSVEETPGWYVLRALPDLLTALACIAAGQLICDESCRVRLSWFDGKWNDEIHVGRTSAIKRMLLLAQREHRGGTSRFLSVERTIAEANLLKRHQELLNFWRDQRGSIDPDSDKHTLNRITNGNFVVAMRDPQTTQVVFTAIGRGIDVYCEPNWRTISTGCAVELQPDLGYGRWVANGYSEAMYDSTPRLTGVDAMICNSRSGTYRRMQYQRLMLPVLRSDGQTALLSASVEDLSLGLRAEIR